MQKKLHISKKSCNFAPDFKTRRSETLKKKQKKLLNYEKESKQTKCNCKNY